MEDLRGMAAQDAVQERDKKVREVKIHLNKMIKEQNQMNDSYDKVMDYTFDAAICKMGQANIEAQLAQVNDTVRKFEEEAIQYKER